MKKPPTVVVLRIAALLMSLQGGTLPGAQPGDSLDGRPRIEVRGFFKEGRPWPKGAVETTVSLERRTLDAGITLSQVLLDQGIAPDAQATDLLGELNPGLSADPPVAGASIVVPRLGTEPRVLKALKEGYRAALTTDTDLKGELRVRLERIKSLRGGVRDALPARARDPEEARRFGELVGFIVDSLERIIGRAENRTVPTQALMDMLAEAALVEECLRRFAASSGPMIEEKDLQTLANVDQDLQARLDALIPVRGRNYSSRVPVRVTIRSAGGGASVGNLRIAYTPVALLDRPPAGQSSGLLSRSGEALTLQLPAANYYLWAADALSYERRSPLLRVDVRAQAGVDALAADLLVP